MSNNTELTIKNELDGSDLHNEISKELDEVEMSYDNDERLGHEKMEIINVSDRKTLKELYDNCAFTIEGLIADTRGLNGLTQWINAYGKFNRKRFYVIKGAYMNKVYGLKGMLAYDDDLDIVCVKLGDIQFDPTFCYRRFEIGGRWFNDVVDNNERHRQELKD